MRQIAQDYNQLIQKIKQCTKVRSWKFEAPNPLLIIKDVSPRVGLFDVILYGHQEIQNHRNNNNNKRKDLQRANSIYKYLGLLFVQLYNQTKAN